MTLPSFDLAGVYRAINESAVTRLVVVPTMLRMIAERGAGLGAGAPTGAGIASIISAGAKLGPQTLAAARRWAPNATIFEYYGASELGFLAATRLEPDRPDSQVATAVGRAFPGVRLMVRDGQGAELAAGCRHHLRAQRPGQQRLPLGRRRACLQPRRGLVHGGGPGLPRPGRRAAFPRPRT